MQGDGLHSVAEIPGVKEAGEVGEVVLVLGEEDVVQVVVMLEGRCDMDLSQGSAIGYSTAGRSLATHKEKKQTKGLEDGRVQIRPSCQVDMDTLGYFAVGAEYVCLWGDEGGHKNEGSGLKE